MNDDCNQLRLVGFAENLAEDLAEQITSGRLILSLARYQPVYIDTDGCTTLILQCGSLCARISVRQALAHDEWSCVLDPQSPQLSNTVRANSIGPICALTEPKENN